jgi:signal transduction histidine kinase/ActR/RegA family two-component response regulator
MSSLADIARLNVLIEVFSECANAADLETLLRIAGGRLRWVVDFDRCTFALSRGAKLECWIATHAHESLRQGPLADLPKEEGGLIERVLESGAPARLPPGKICVPIQVVGRTIGAICFASEVETYTYRDLRLGHHAGQYLGSLISRMDLEQETRRASKHKDDLLALLSHELRNPLAPIVTAVRLLKMRAQGEPAKELDVIDRQAQHLVRLVDDLLDVARLTRGKVVLERAPVELARVVARAVEMVSPLVDQRRHLLAIKVPPVGLIVDVDENRLAQVVSNLLSNAAHYTREGGHIGVAARREGESVVLEVSDDGVGIAREALSDIFDLFVQGTNRPSGQGGLGLGLAVVKQLTELHGGSVSVASEGAGRGTQFTIRLPFQRPGLLTSADFVTSLRIPPTDAPQRVLLVDDNDDALDLLSTVVETAGHKVIVAHDGAAALATLDRFQPSVAVIDIGMPLMDGYELAASIRAHQSGGQPYLVALTGYGQATDRERSRAVGFDEHLVKPVDLARLLRVIAGGRVHLTPSEGAAE